MTTTKRNLVSGAMAAFMALATPYSTSLADDSWTPPEGSEQYDMLKPNEDFIRFMRLSDYYSCCTLRDGRADLKEEFNKGANPNYPAKDYPYIVTVTHDLTGKKLDEPTIVYIPKDKVLTLREARSICKPIKLTHPDSSCDAPPFNVLWAYDNSQEPDYKSGKVKHRMTSIFCYFPKPNLQ